MPRHVLSPNGGETWTTGQTATVTWQRGYGDSAKVEISATSGTTAIALLAHAAPDTGRLTLSVPGGLDKNCSSCKIQVQHTAGTYDGGSGELVGKDASDNAIALHDGVAPSAVTLNVDEISNQSVALTWLAPGDDGNVGTASGYEVRYSTSPINAGNWTSATVASNPPTPHASGYTEYCWVSSLSANRTYYFALKSKDAVPNWSAMSNCVSAKTLPAGGGGGGSAAPAGPGVWSATPGTRRGVSFAALDSSGTGSIVQWRLAAEEARSPDQVLWRVYWASDSLDSAQIAAVRAVTLQTPDSSGKWLDRADYASRTIPSLAAFVGYLDPLARLLMTGGYVPVAMAARAHSTTDSTHDFVLRDLRSANQGSSVAPDSVMQALTTLTVGDTLTATYARVDSVSLDAQEWWVLVQAPTMTGGRGPAHQVPLTSALPTRFALLQNRPNPFGVATTLRFDLPSPEHVRLQVFDMQGRRVCTLADQSFDAGQWSVDWNARNEAGALARPGVYLYRIEAGRFRSQKKMVLLP